MIGIILISSMGFSVNTLYCFCMGQYEASLFEIQHSCTKEHERIASMPKEHSCCSKAKACSTKKAKDENKDCTKKTKKYFKADLKFLEFKKSSLIDFEFEEVQLAFLQFSRTSEINNFQYKSLFTSRPPPPQYYGRQLLNFIQIYRC